MRTRALVYQMNQMHATYSFEANCVCRSKILDVHDVDDTPSPMKAAIDMPPPGSSSSVRSPELNVADMMDNIESLKFDEDDLSPSARSSKVDLLNDLEAEHRSTVVTE